MATAPGSLERLFIATSGTGMVVLQVPVADGTLNRFSMTPDTARKIAQSFTDKAEIAEQETARGN